MRLLLIGLLVAVATSEAVGQNEASLAGLFTRAEVTDYEETSRYADVMKFAATVAEASPVIHLTSFGRSFEGRVLPLLVVGGGEDPSPAGVLGSGKTRVFIQANIHAGEVCGKEAMLMLLRDIARGHHRSWLDSLVLLVAPIYNADGNERVTLTNRGRQHGPIAGMGQRPNAQGYDLNRDHMKLDSPEARSLVRLMNEFDPHVVLDLHTTNGTRHGYHITYAPPLHPNTDARIDRILREEWLPAAGAYLRETEGWESFYYGNAGRPGTASPQWRTFDHRPRFNNNYVGLRNRFAILSEAYSYATFEDRVISTLRFVEGAVHFAHRHATRIRETVAAVDGTPLTGQSLAVRAQPTGTGPVDILMGEVVEERNPYSGATILRRRDVARPVQMTDFGTFAATESIRAPAAYVVPGDQTAVLNKLMDHGIRVERVRRLEERPGQIFVVDSTRQAPREFQQHRERTVFGAYRDGNVALAPGDVVVPVAQPLGRLVVTLLEPRSDDGLTNWNVLDRALESASEHPVRRLTTWP